MGFIGFFEFVGFAELYLTTGEEPFQCFLSVTGGRPSCFQAYPRGKPRLRRSRRTRSPLATDTTDALRDRIVQEQDAVFHGKISGRQQLRRLGDKPVKRRFSSVRWGSQYQIVARRRSQAGYEHEFLAVSWMPSN